MLQSFTCDGRGEREARVWEESLCGLSFAGPEAHNSNNGRFVSGVGDGARSVRRRLGLAHWAEEHKPVAGMTTHLMLAWMMWATVGLVLMGFGTWWSSEAAPGIAPWIIAGALAIGVVKSRLVLDRAARRVIERICARGDGRCVGGFLSLRTWGFVVLMMVGGRVLRGTLAHGIVGPVYIAVGSALFLSSRLTWHAWREAQCAA